MRKSFRRACKALEKRFGPSLTPEAQRSRSANLQQEEKEALRQFADSIRRLATEAYPDLPSTFIESEIINRFLMGCSAKEVGLFCLNLKHESLDAAVQAFKLYVERQPVVFGQKKVRRVEAGEDSEDSEPSKMSRVQSKHEVLHPLSAANTAEGGEIEEIKKRLDGIQEPLKRLHSMQITGLARQQRVELS